MITKVETSGGIIARRLFLVIIAVLLLVTVLVPAAISWLGFVSQLPLKTSGLQWLTLALLLVSGYQSVWAYKNNAPVMQTSIVGVSVFLIAVLVYLAASILHIYGLLWTSTIAVIACLGWTLYGYGFFKRHLSWFLFALFLLPQMPVDLYSAVSVPLQLFSTRITVAFAQLLIPVTHKGAIFFINQNAFEVTVACSGLYTWIGFLFAGMLWLLFETFFYKRLAFIVAAAPLLALITNTLRLFITALTAYYASADTAIAVHTNLEYILFPLGLMGMAWLGRRCHV